MRNWFLGPPNPSLAVERYRLWAAGYDRSCQRSWAIRQAAIQALALRTGETVFDVACGTGLTLVELARAVGPTGQAIGIEISPEMVAIARGKIAANRLNAQVELSSIEALELVARADAMLFCYTHDVLQSEAAIARLLRHAKPGCRFVVAGTYFQPWVYGWPLNIFTGLRARGYLTTFQGLRRPWAKLEAAGGRLQIQGYYDFGSSYLATGHFGR